MDKFNDKIKPMSQKMFITGNEAVVMACIDAGAVLMCGYPITPATEILQLWAEEAEKNKNLNIIQAEDEISAGFNVIGSLLAGKIAFTATAGPGHILMQDPLAMAEAMRLPFVGIIMQRGGPSTGTVIYGQQEVTMACFGGNGEGHRIVYSTSSPQDLFDYTKKAFVSAWKYRFPTIILGDGYQSKMSQQVIIDSNKIDIKTEPIVGTDKNMNIRNCFNFEGELAVRLHKDHEQYINNISKIVESEQIETKDAKKLIIAHGIIANAAKDAVKIARSQGKKVGLFRPITLSPFDFVTLSHLASHVDEILIVESSYGHFERLVKAGLYGLAKIKTLQKPVQSIDPGEILKYL